MFFLSVERLIPNMAAFTYVGIYYVGPLYVKQKRSNVKRYGCIFVCYTTRAVHLEVAHSLDTDSFFFSKMHQQERNTAKMFQ